MDYRNKLGVFTFDDNTSTTIVELIACTVMGQYLNPKQGEPELTDEQSCYNFIMERCGQVIASVPFELAINDNVRVWTKEQLRAKRIRDFDQRVQDLKQGFEDAGKRIKKAINVVEKFLVGPASLEEN